MVEQRSDTADRQGPPLDVAVVPTRRNWAALIIVLLVIGVIERLMPFISGLLGAAALYVVVEGFYKRLAHRMPSALAAILTIVASLVLVVGPITWLATVLIGRAPDALSEVLASSFLERLGEVRIAGVPVGGQIEKVSGAIVASIPTQLGRFVGTVTSFVLNLTIAMFGLYYLLRASTGRWEAFRNYVPFSTDTADALRDRFVGATRATILGTGAVCAVQGFLVGLGFMFSGLPDPVFWGTVALFAAIVPEIGSALVWIPGVIVLLSQHRFGGAITLFIFGFGLAGNIDRIIRPFIYRRVSEIHPMITLVGALAGIRYFGFVGLLLGPLAIVYVFELLRFYREEYAT